MKIICTTSNAYKHIIPIFCYLFNKNWSKDQEVEIVGYDKPDCTLPPNFTFYSLGKQEGGPKNFSTDLRKYFEKQDSHFLWLMEDCFIRSVGIDRLNFMHHLAFTNSNIGRISLNEASVLQDHLLTSLSDHFDIVENAPTALYRLATQPSIWNRDFLLKYLTPNLTPWEFETQKSINDGWRIIGPKEPIVECNEGVTKHNIFDYNFNKVSQLQIIEMRSLGILNNQINTMTTRDRILEKYLKVCKEASESEEVFNAFKVNVDYKEVLEHLSVHLGEKHLELIEKNNPHLLDIDSVWNNDVYGSPELADYIVGDRLVRCSPTTLQYISVASNLIDLFKTFYQFEIIEIGGGYGGQCKVFHDISDIKRYDIIDLEECGLLQKKYLSKFGIEAGIYSPADPIFREYDLFISNYALSEVSSEDQLDYVINVCLKCKHGYITCNQPLNGMNLIEEKFKDTFKISPDIEGERETNYLITW